MKKIAVITASIGSLDLYDPTEYLDQVDYHAFVTDDKVNVKDNWIRHKAPEFSTDPMFKGRRDAKLPKILPQLMVPGYEYYIWMDCTNRLICDPRIMIDKYLFQSDIAGFHHPRGCAYKELVICKQNKIDTPENVDSTRKFLESQKFPKDFGLIENTCRIQRNTPLMLQMGLMWWELICRYSSRDQVTFPYVWWKLGFKPTIMPGKAQGKNDFMPLMRYGTHKRVM